MYLNSRVGCTGGIAGGIAEVREQRGGILSSPYFDQLGKLKANPTLLPHFCYCTTFPSVSYTVNFPYFSITLLIFVPSPTATI